MTNPFDLFQVFYSNHCAQHKQKITGLWHSQLYENEYVSHYSAFFMIAVFTIVRVKASQLIALCLQSKKLRL